MAENILKELESTHTLAGVYVMRGITPEQFLFGRHYPSLNYTNLKAQFKMICHDFGEELEENPTSRAVDFCTQILMHVRPESIKITNTRKNKRWIFTFSYDAPVNTLKTDSQKKVVFTTDATVNTVETDSQKKVVSTTDAPVNTLETDSQQEVTSTVSKITKKVFVDMNTDDETSPEQISDHIISISVNHAILLATDTFTKWSTWAFNKVQSEILLTPMAKAVYTTDDITKMAALTDTTMIDVIHTVNESCIPEGGHYLPNSSPACALAYYFKIFKYKYGSFWTNNFERIIEKIALQYKAKKKDLVLTDFAMFLAFATGELPSAAIVKKILKEYGTAYTDNTKTNINVPFSWLSNSGTFSVDTKNSSGDDKSSITIEVLATWVKQFPIERKIGSTNEAGSSSAVQ